MRWLRDAGGRFLFCGARGAFDCFAAAPFGSRFFFGRAFLEFFYATSRVYKFLFTRIKRVALVAELNANFFHGAASDKFIATGTGHLAVGVVLRMDFGFHRYRFRQIF